MLDIDGNLVLVDEVYLAALDLPAEAAPTPATARLVERKILAFLRRAGYALASVEAEAAGGRIRVLIDEGRLARIVVRGRDAFSTVAFQLQLDLPFDVFNRPQLERLLPRFAGGGARVTYRLVLTRKVRHTGPQMNPLALMPGSAPLPARGLFELHIEFAGADEGSSFALVAGIDPDSIRAGGGYSGRSGIIDGDRWDLGAQVGANFFVDLRRQADELHFSRVLTDSRWMSPNILGLPLRPTLRLREDLLRRQRQDLLVESYWWNRLEGAAGLTVEPWTGIVLTAELGAQRRDLFNVTQLEEAGEAGIEEIGPSSDLRYFAGLSGRLDFEPYRLRWDRRQRLIFEVRRFLGLDRRPLWLVDAEYRKVFELGWNDIWLRGALGGVAGTYEIADAIPMTGRYLRGVFGHALYLDRVASVAFEYRVSLTRDVYKLGFFHDAAIFREESGEAPGPDFRGGNSFGPSFHALVLDALQLDIFYAAGFLFDGGTFDHGVTLRIEKAF
jgi:hypothetical protein